MRRGWQLTSTVMLLICIGTAWEAHDLSLFDRLGPGPGFFPFWLAIIGAVLCGIILIQVSLRPTSPDRPALLFPRGETAWRTAAVLACAALATALMDWIGFRLAIALFSVTLLVALGERRWWAVLAFAAIAGFGIFHIFNDWLDVLLPVGAFGI